MLVAHVSISVAHEVQQVEGDGQEGSAQEVTDGRQVRDGGIVRVGALDPDQGDHPRGDVQENDHLCQCSNKVEHLERQAHGGVSSLHIVDGVHKQQVARDGQQDQHACCTGVHTFAKECHHRIEAAQQLFAGPMAARLALLVKKG